MPKAFLPMEYQLTVFQVIFVFLFVFSVRIVFVTDVGKGIESGPGGIKSLRII